MSERQHVLQVENATMQFGGVVAVNNLTMEVNEGEIVDVGADIFARGLCLPSDNKMSEEEQERIIEIVKRCFR